VEGTLINGSELPSESFNLTGSCSIDVSYKTKYTLRIHIPWNCIINLPSSGNGLSIYDELFPDVNGEAVVDVTAPRGYALPLSYSVTNSMVPAYDGVYSEAASTWAPTITVVIGELFSSTDVEPFPVSWRPGNLCTFSVEPDGDGRGSIGVAHSPKAFRDSAMGVSNAFLSLAPCPAPGFQFFGWELNWPGLMPWLPVERYGAGDLNFIAHFLPCAKLNIEISGKGDKPECMGYCTVNTAKKYYNMYESVTVTPHALPGYKFLGWGGNGSTGEGEGEGEGEGQSLEDEANLVTTPSITLRMTATRNLDAHFGPDDPGTEVALMDLPDPTPDGPTDGICLSQLCNGQLTWHCDWYTDAQGHLHNHIFYYWKGKQIFDCCIEEATDIAPGLNKPVIANLIYWRPCVGASNVCHSLCHINFEYKIVNGVGKWWCRSEEYTVFTDKRVSPVDTYYIDYAGNAPSVWNDAGNANAHKVSAPDPCS
jgi:hypothetical protein